MEAYNEQGKSAEVTESRHSGVNHFKSSSMFSIFGVRAPDMPRSFPNTVIGLDRWERWALSYLPVENLGQNLGQQNLVPGSAQLQETQAATWGVPSVSLVSISLAKEEIRSEVEGLCTWELDLVVMVAVCGEGADQQITSHTFASFSSQWLCTHLQQPLGDEISKEVFISKSRSSCFSLRP